MRLVSDSQKERLRDDGPERSTRAPGSRIDTESPDKRAGSRIGLGEGAGMDVARGARKKTRRNLYIGFGSLALIAVTVMLARLEPAAPSVDRNILLFGTVERGSFVREVRGPGTLLPEQMVYVAALTGGRVEQVLHQPGQTVADTSVLIVLSNPDVELEALQAQQQLVSARAGLVDLERSLGSMLLQQRSAVATSEAEFANARREAEQYASLVENQTISRNEAARAREMETAARVRLETERDRLVLLEETVGRQQAVQREQVERLESITGFQERRVQSMQVTAGSGGILQDLDLEIGEWVMPGTTLARVAQPGKLKAELRIPETQARDVVLNQPVIIDTRTDSITGRVSRVDPNVQNGSVLVEVRLEGELPPSARSDLSVDGTVEIDRLEDVLYVDRPAYGQSNSTVSLFRVAESEKEASRTTVRFGRSSVNQIEIIEGLDVGDVVILSDMSRWDDTDRVRIRG